MSSDNGGIIGVVNDPTSTVASGVWQQEEQYEAKVNGTWPQRPLFTTKSVRLAGDAYGQKSISNSGSGTTATFSAWIKLSALPDKALFTSYIDSNNYVEIYFSSGQFRVFHYDSGSTSNDVKTTPVYRDQSAWYNFHVIFDTTNGTEADRIQIYVNGTRVTSLATSNYPTSSQDLELNSSSATLNFAARNADEQFLGYMSEIIWVDGQALAPTSFGVSNSDGVWTPIPYTGTFGTNGFNLQFENAAALGEDSSANGNNFTVNNLTSIDQSTDYPEVNFATLNPLHFGTTIAPSYSNLSEGNLKFVSTQSGSPYPYYFSTIAVSQGKWYAEFKRVNSTAIMGIATGVADSYLGNNANDYAMYENGQIITSGSGTAYGDAMDDNDIIGVAMDLDNNKLYFSNQGVFQNSGVPTSGSTGTGAVSITAPGSNGTGVYHFAVGDSGGGTPTINCNFGSPMESISSGNKDGNGYGNFEYAVPSGYYSLNTKNLAEFG